MRVSCDGKHEYTGSSIYIIKLALTRLYLDDVVLLDHKLSLPGLPRSGAGKSMCLRVGTRICDDEVFVAITPQTGKHART